jgi:hypothetical protein
MSKIEPLNKKARAISASRPGDVQGYAVEGCCPTFVPGWEVDSSGNVDPCPWQADLAACTGFAFLCWWAGQVPDAGNNPNWLDNCGNIQNDWTNLCVIPD